MYISIPLKVLSANILFNSPNRFTQRIERNGPYKIEPFEPSQRVGCVLGFGFSNFFFLNLDSKIKTALIFFVDLTLFSPFSLIVLLYCAFYWSRLRC